MRKRSTMLASIFAAAAIAIPVSIAVAGPTVTGSDGNTQSLEAVVSPKSLPKKTATPGTLKVTVKTGTTSPTGIPSPAVHDVIDFDQSATLFTKGLPTCDPNAIQNTSTEVAEQKCGKAKIGTGTSTTLLPLGGVGTPELTKVTAFNGVPQGGKPVVLLHAYGTSPVQTTLVLIGVVSNLNKEGYGPRLDVTVPPIAGGNGAITDFQVTINKKWSYKGKQVSFIAAKCPAAKKLKSRGAFTFKDGVTLTALATQSCTQAPEAKK
jgi:hypothetical protein